MTGESIHNLCDLGGKVALITGAGRGFGRFFSRKLAEAGANLVCLDFDKDSLGETAALIHQNEGRVLPVIADVSLPLDVKRMGEHIVSEFGRLDIAINNAGIVTRPHRFHELPREDWERVLAVDLTGVFICMQEELRVMVKQKSGTIINIASVAGLRGVPPEFMPRANYVAAKHGVIGLTKQAALEYARDNIRINAIAPGWFGGTDLSRERRAGKPDADESIQQRRTEFIPLGRKGRLQELAGAILFLSSDASSYVTGQVLVLDGGVTAR
jgi:gluconate 5-dehydrogenase